MRTDDEIVARIKEVAPNDLLGWSVMLLAEYLPEYRLKDAGMERRDDDPEPWAQKLSTDEAVREDMYSYLNFAWGKCVDHRGISANRSTDKYSQWVWLLNLPDLEAQYEAAEYPMYGAPKLKVITDVLWPAYFEKHSAESMIEINRMIAGESCVPGCEMGCLS